MAEIFKGEPGINFRSAAASPSPECAVHAPWWTSEGCVILSPGIFATPRGGHMVVPKEPTWHRDPHTAAKHDVLRQYLQAWAPILLSRNDIVTYAEGFAGPGIYKGGEAGSPVIAHQVLAGSLRQRAGKRVKMVLVEEDGRRKTELEQQLAHARENQPGPELARLETHVTQGGCHPDLLRNLAQTGSLGHPMFVLLDGFGSPEVPFALLQQVARHRSSEVMITFQPQFLVRFAQKDGTHRAAGDAFFGNSDWHSVFALPSNEKAPYLRDQYRRTLRAAGFDHSLSFEMIDEKRHLLYLIFGTSHEKGVEKMKEAMWKVDTTTGVRYCDPKDPDQQVLELTLEPDTGPLRRILIEYLRSSPDGFTVAALQRFALLETVYRPAQVIPALTRLREEKRITTTAPGRIVRSTQVTATHQDALF
ncbi:three-Cys-motif partner protein TcmP [Kitasatospora sp. NPDC057015]|uniref:three-Cys-motif partner protein TcmP n=1 Tax=Kitasatospora sp. NPDC057015 TaxID=3346001 RepID=UPI003632E994